MTSNAATHEPTDNPLERAVARIVSQPFEALSLEHLAQAAGLSAYHFTRQFTSHYGISPMAFARAHRLALAAQALRGEAPPALIDLAFDCGFESQEGFTRAFKRAFGVSPGKFRRAAPPIMETLMSDTATALRLTMEPVPARKPALRVAGLSGVFTETNKAGIPALWDRLIPHLPVAGQTGDDSYGVCWGEGDGGFHYMAAVPIAADAPVPPGLELKEVAARSYLVFRQITDGTALHPQMQAAVKEIWGERLPKSGHKLANAPDLEAYQPNFEPDRAGDWVEWWIPVEA